MDFELGRKSIVEWAEEAPETEAGSDFTPAREKFLVEMPIGSGGMGEVFLVTDQDLRRQCLELPQGGDAGESRLPVQAEHTIHAPPESVAMLEPGPGGP